MKDINIATILAEKRREKGETQDQIAAYIGVSKASVSKWETGQSYPDITFLPQLASYFNISIDALMGYTPQMTKEDIQALYNRLSSDFSTRPFLEVWEDCQEVIKKYYACFPLLMQMAVLLCNHWMLAEDPALRQSVLEMAIGLCERIQSESEDVRLSKEAASLTATCYLMMGQPQKVLAVLGETIRPFTNDDLGIAQAYFMLGNLEQANRVLQITIYQHLLTLIGASTSLLQLQNDQFDEILYRIMTVAEVFELERLHPNSMAITYLTAAHGYCIRKDLEKAMDMIERYTKLCTMHFFPFALHGDRFFNELDHWFKEFDLGAGAPRNEAVIKESMVQSLTANPAFDSLKDQPRFKRIVEALKFSLEGYRDDK
jgi:transcriptional regulator with XRE-family HTH domain